MLEYDFTVKSKVMVSLSEIVETQRCPSHDENLLNRFSIKSLALLLCLCVVNRGDMTLTRGSFTYASGEEYHGEWKEGKTVLNNT